MKKSIRVSAVLTIVLFSVSFLTGTAMGDCCGGPSSTSPSNLPPTPVEFLGEITQTVPCNFFITLSSTDSDGTVEAFDFNGTLPPGYVLSGDLLSGYAISGPTLTNNCGPETYLSSWVAIDDDDASSSPASSLTLTCRERENQPPEAPTYTGDTTLKSPCTFNITLHSNDPPDGRIRAYELVDGSLPPGYSLEGNVISGGTVSCEPFALAGSIAEGNGAFENSCEWSASFRAHDNDCEPGPASELTLRCTALNGLDN